MRLASIGLAAAFCVLSTSTAYAGLSPDLPQRSANHATINATSLERAIPLAQMLSPSMQLSQMEMDALKEDGFDGGLPFAFTEETPVRSDLIYAYKATQISGAQPGASSGLRALTGALILLSGLVMWAGLGLQRRY